MNTHPAAIIGSAAKERPVIFSDAMVRAILAGKKTQTRRVVKNIPPILKSLGHRKFRYDGCGCPEEKDAMTEWHYVEMLSDGKTDFTTAARGHDVLIPAGEPTESYFCVGECPYGKAGDRLWVREAWRRYELEKSYGYRADHELPAKGIWRSPIHMPRAASRITLEITGVRVERVQDITEADAKAEGIMCKGPCYAREHQDKFCALWDENNAERGFGWEVNPFVWVVAFRRAKT